MYVVYRAQIKHDMIRDFQSHVSKDNFLKKLQLTQQYRYPSIACVQPRRYSLIEIAKPRGIDRRSDALWPPYSAHPHARRKALAGDGKPLPQ